MGSTVFVGSEFVAKYAEGGGNFWVPLQYLEGLLELGHDAWWLELVGTSGDPDIDRAKIDRFRRNVADMGVTDRVAIAYFPSSPVGEISAATEWIGLDEGQFRARARDALLLNLANSIPAPMRDSFARTALFDIDPGPFQIWAREWGMGVGAHDVHLTIGMNLGASDSPVPVGDVKWRRSWPSIHLGSWPVQPVSGGGHYTTITQWWTTQYAFLDGETYDCNKREGFVAHIDLPRRAGLELEIAANVHADEKEDRALLAANGWLLVDPAVAAGDPRAFRHYVQQARGEVSCAKPAYVKARSGWVSDRTLCFLASGRPCIVEDVGTARHLPETLGLTFFRDTTEGAARLRAVEADYGKACREARALAEDLFSTRVTLPKILAACGA